MRCCTFHIKQSRKHCDRLLVKIGQSEDGQSRGGKLRSNLRAGARGESEAEMTWPSALYVNNNTSVTVALKVI